MQTAVNDAARGYARSLIKAGQINRDGAWSFSAADADKLLGPTGDDFTAYGQSHLGIDTGQPDGSRGRFKYPFAKDGKVWRKGLIAIRQRSAQQEDLQVYAAAGDLMAELDAQKKDAVMSIETRFTPFEFKFAEAGDDPAGTFEGYASTFNNEDDGGDVMLPGAFDATMARHKAAGTMPKMLLNHGGLGGFNQPSPDDMLPVGKWLKMSPDSAGLQCKGRLINLDTERGKGIYGAMKEGELGDMSIAYIPKEFVRGTKPNEPRRQLKAVDLFEAGPVTFPMNRQATIGSVKSLSGMDAHDWRDLEAALRDEGLSQRDAARAIAGFKIYLRRDGGAPEQGPRDEATSDDLRALAAKIRAAA